MRRQNGCTREVGRTIEVPRFTGPRGSPAGHAVLDDPTARPEQQLHDDQAGERQAHTAHQARPPAANRQQQHVGHDCGGHDDVKIHGYFEDIAGVLSQHMWAMSHDRAQHELQISQGRSKDGHAKQFSDRGRCFLLRVRPALGRHRRHHDGRHEEQWSHAPVNERQHAFVEHDSQPAEDSLQQDAREERKTEVAYPPPRLASPAHDCQRDRQQARALRQHAMAVLDELILRRAEPGIQRHEHAVRGEPIAKRHARAGGSHKPAPPHQRKRRARQHDGPTMGPARARRRRR
jgi:hypothetical protein